MADAKKSEADDAAPAPKKKGKLLLFIIIGVVVLAIAVVAVVLLTKKKPAAEDEAEGETTSKTEAKGHSSDPAKPPAYVKLDPFTSNLAADEAAPVGTSQYVQVEVQLKVEDAHIAETIKPFTAEIRHEVLRILSGKKAAQLSTIEGRDKLAEEILLAVNTVINPPKKPKKGAKEAEPEGPVVKVLFSSFIIQAA
jgi:flagellar protein FliL